MSNVEDIIVWLSRYFVVYGMIELLFLVVGGVVIVSFIFLIEDIVFGE